MLVPVYFATEKLGDKLRKAGFNPRLSAVFILEGVTMYIPRYFIHSSITLACRAHFNSRAVLRGIASPHSLLTAWLSA